jgi:type VI secretion system protein ImpJ
MPVDLQQKVLWNEGLFLTPHHFQQWDRHNEAEQWFRLRALNPLASGFAELVIDEDALATGELVLNRCAGIMPDGLPFACPDVDQAPPTRQLGSIFDAKGSLFDTRRGAVGIYLAAPLVRPGTKAVSESGIADGLPTRFRQTGVLVRDENTATNEREVVVARKALRVLFEGESRDDYAWLKLAEVVRGASGRVELVPNFIPPCLQLRASERLRLILRRLLEILSARSGELAQQRRNRGAGVVEFAISESAAFALLQIINTALPGIRHCHSQDGSHPERIFGELSRLAGALYTFAGDGHVKDLPLYVHDDLGATFDQLEEQLRNLINVVIPTRAVRITLKQERETTFSGELRQVEDDTAFYLALTASVQPEKLVREVPLKIKITAPEDLDFHIAQAIRGVAVHHLPSPPPELPIYPDWQYFKLATVGEQWKSVESARKIAIHLPIEFKGLRVELLAVGGQA